jgi:hypothetical protein
VYVAEIKRGQPTAILMVVDQSSSMNDLMHSGKTKAQHVADALNRTLQNLVIRGKTIADPAVEELKKLAR